MAGHDYREAYFEAPELLETGAPRVLRISRRGGAQRAWPTPRPDGVVALLGAGTLFGLGDAVKVSALLERGQRRGRRAAARLLPRRARGQQLSAARRPRRMELPGDADHSRRGTVDDDHEPGALLRGTRQRTKIPNDGVAKVVRPETEQQWDVLRVGTAELRVRRRVRPRPRADPRQLPQRTSAKRSSRRCGSAASTAAASRTLCECSSICGATSSCRAASVPASCVNAARRRARPSHRALHGRQAPRWIVVGGRHTGGGQERRRPAGVPLCAVRKRRPARGVPAGPLHDLGAGERLPRGAAGCSGGRGKVARQGDPRSLCLAGHRQGAPRSRPEPRRLGARTCASCSGRSSHRRSRTSPTTRCSTPWTMSCGCSRRREDEAAAHPGRARRDAAVHRR